MDQELLLGRIEERLKVKGLSERKACLNAGLKVDAVRQIRRGFVPKLATLVALAKVLEVPSSFFRAAISDDELDELAETPIDPSDIPQGYLGVRTTISPFGLGDGADGSEDIIGPIAMLPERLIRHDLRGEANDFVLAEVEGQSMEPVLESGDQVLIDRRKKDPRNEGLFALWDGSGMVIKWMEKIRKSDPPAFRLISENKRFTPYEVLAEEAKIVGRVVWFARKL